MKLKYLCILAVINSFLPQCFKAEIILHLENNKLCYLISKSPKSITVQSVCKGVSCEDILPFYLHVQCSKPEIQTH